MAKDWAKPFYNSDIWKTTRKEILRQSGYSCEICGGHAREVHHEIELTPDNVWNPEISLNPKLLHSLCGDCHKAITKRQKGKKLDDCDEGFCFDDNGNLTPGEG